MSVYKKHQNEIKKQNNKFPLMEYFLSGKQTEECYVECQNQLNELNFSEDLYFQCDAIPLSANSCISLVLICISIGFLFEPITDVWIDL